nr:hypothetical protein [Tanacetum cinerariifolium]
MDANKNIDLKNPMCLNESKIMEYILQNHPLRFSIAASSVPWIYLGQFSHTLKEDRSKYLILFMLDSKELTLILDDFRIIFQLPQATDNNHERFVATPKFSKMVALYINDLGFTLELRSPSNFKTIGLVQLWETLCKMFSRCLTTRVTGFDQPLLQIIQIACDKYHNLKDDEMGKIIFNSGKNKKGVGMKIPSWMITDEMKLTEHYQMCAVVFGLDVPMTHWMITDEMKLTEHYQMCAVVFRLDVPMTQSQPIMSTQGTHRTTRTPMTPNPDVDKGESSAPRKSTAIKLCIPLRRTTRLTLPTPIPTTIEANDDTEKLVEGTENVGANEVDSSTRRQNDNQNYPSTRLEPNRNKESLEVEITAKVQPVNVNEEDEESAEDDYKLKRREKGRIYFFEHLKERLMPRKKFHVLAQHLQEIIEESLPKMVDTHVQELIKTQVPIYQADVAKMIADAIQQDQINNAITNHIPSQDYLPIWLTLKYKFERLHVSNTSCRPFAVRPRDQDDPHDDSHPEGENSVKRIHDFQLGVESYQQKVNLTAPTITFLDIEKYKLFSIISEPVYGIIYKNNKKEKRVMRHQKVHKFFDATLKRVLKELKSYNNNVKHGYVTLSLSREDVEYLQLFEEEIKERLKHRNLMRCYEIQNEQNIQKYYKTKYKKVKAKLALLEAGPLSAQSLKPFHFKYKGLVVETFDWDEDEVSDDGEIIQIKVLMALADDELTVRKTMLEMYALPSKQNLKAKAKPFPPCTHRGFNDHRPNDCRNYLSVKYVEAMIMQPHDTIMSFVSGEVS